MERHQESKVAPYEGNDMINFMLSQGPLLFGEGRYGNIKSITNVHDTAIVVMERAVFRVRPDWGTGLCIELVSHL